MSLSRLASEYPKYEQIRHFALLTENDIDDVNTLARKVNGEVLTSASDAVMALRTINEVIRIAKNTNEGTGWLPTQPEARSWQKAMEDGQRSLQEIEKTCRSIAVG